MKLPLIQMFRRKSTKQSCSHKWTDVHVDGKECWYIQYKLDSENVLRYEIYEPYVCIHCKERKDVLLYAQEIDLSRHYMCDIPDQISSILESVQKKYKQIKDRVIVEDAINDLQLVDRNYLQIAANVMGVKF